MINKINLLYSKCLISKLVLSFIVLTSLAACKEDGGLIFHDSFEYYEVGQAPAGPWTTSGKGVVSVDSTKSNTGKFSIYFESSEKFENRAFLRLVGNPLFPFKYNRISGSFYIWLEEASPDGIHWTMIQASGKVKDTDYRSEIRYGGQHQKQFMANYDTKGKNTDCWHHSTTAMPEKEWTKIGWLFDAKNQTMKFWLNDVLIDQLTVMGQGQGCMGKDLEDKWVFPVFDELLIGWVDYQSGGGSRRFWIDDVMLYQ